MKKLIKACLSLIAVNAVIFTGCQICDTAGNIEQTQTQIKVFHENIINEDKEPGKVTNTWKEDLNGDGVTDNI